MRRKTKYIDLKLTDLQWINIIEGLETAGSHFAHIEMSAKTRKHGKKLMTLASNLRRRLEGKL